MSNGGHRTGKLSLRLERKAKRDPNINSTSPDYIEPDVLGYLLLGYSFLYLIWTLDSEDALVAPKTGQPGQNSLEFLREAISFADEKERFFKGTNKLRIRYIENIF